MKYSKKGRTKGFSSIRTTHESVTPMFSTNDDFSFQDSHLTRSVMTWRGNVRDWKVQYPKEICYVSISIEYPWSLMYLTDTTTHLFKRHIGIEE